MPGVKRFLQLARIPRQECFLWVLFFLCEELIKLRDQFLEFAGVLFLTDELTQLHNSFGVCLAHLAAPH